MRLSQAQKDRIQEAIKNGTFQPRTELLKLMTEGFSAEEAQTVLKKQIQEFKNKEDAKFVPFWAAGVLGVLSALLNITSPIWYLITTLIALGLAYWSDKEKPVATIAASMCLLILMPIASSFYFAGRTSFINLEIIIPGIIAALPSFAVYKIVKAIVYK